MQDIQLKLAVNQFALHQMQQHVENLQLELNLFKTTAKREFEELKTQMYHEMDNIR